MACIRISSDLTFGDELQQVFRRKNQQYKDDVTHIKQCAVLIVAMM